LLRSSWFPLFDSGDRYGNVSRGIGSEFLLRCPGGLRIQVLFCVELAQFLLKIFRFKALLPESLGFIQIFWKREVLSVENHSFVGIKDKLLIAQHFVSEINSLLESLDKRLNISQAGWCLVAPTGRHGHRSKLVR
jgi:hypothetical protein